MEYFLVYKQTYNNIFGTVVDGVGRVVAKRSGGQCGLQRSTRNSLYAGGAIGSSLGRLCRKRGIRRVTIRCHSRIAKKNMYFIRSFCKSGIKLNNKLDLRIVGIHNSFRPKKLRRL